MYDFLNERPFDLLKHDHINKFNEAVKKAVNSTCSIFISGDELKIKITIN